MPCVLMDSALPFAPFTCYPAASVACSYLMSYGLTFDDGTTNSWKNSEVDVSGNLYRETNYSFTLGVGEYINKVWGSGQMGMSEYINT